MWSWNMEFSDKTNIRKSEREEGSPQWKRAARKKVLFLYVKISFPPFSVSVISLFLFIFSLCEIIIFSNLVNITKTPYMNQPI